MNALRKLVRRLGTFTKIGMTAAFLLIFYGYLCRRLQLYFFWESSAIGIGLLQLSGILLLTDFIRIKHTVRKHTLPERLGIAIIGIVLLAQAIFLVTLPNTDAYAAAKAYLPCSPELCEEVGDIRSFSLMPAASIQQSADSSGQFGNAALSLIIKGDKKFADITIFVAHYPDSTGWKVEGID